MTHTDDEADDYFVTEPSQERIVGDTEISVDGDRLEMVLADDSVGVCYDIKAVRVCVESISAERVVLIAYIAGVKVAKATLTPASACIKIKRSVGGDMGKVEAKICADFRGKKLTIEGKVCALFACTRFKQTILKW